MTGNRWGRFRDGFWNWVRVPAIRFRHEADEATLRERLTPRAKLSAKEIRRLVQLLRSKRQRHVASDILQEIGEPAVPALIAALRSDRFWSAKDTDCFDAALWLLDDVAPPELFSVLLPRLNSEYAPIRESAARHMANLGLDESIEPLQEAITRYGLASQVAQGLKSCLERGGGTARFRDAMFQPMLEALEEDSNALGAHEISLCRDRLLRFVEALRENHDGYPAEYQYGSCLQALARVKDECAGPLLRDAIEDVNDSVRHAACSASLWWHDIRDPYAPFAKRWEAEGLEALTQPQKVYVVVDRLYAEVSNGGFAQYFANSTGDYAGYAVEAYRRIGATETAQIVARAVSLFGPEGPSPSRDARSYQLSRLSDDDFAVLEQLDSAYYDGAHRVETLLTMYVLENSDHFRESAGVSMTR